jgi:hypothetical protein
MPAIMSSASTAATTIPAQPHDHSSQVDDALSNWVSVAFVVPFGKRHAGKGFRGFWIELGLGALMSASLFAGLYVFQ